MPFDLTKTYIPSADQVAQTWRDDVRLVMLQQDIDVPPIQPNTDEYATSVGLGHLAAGCYTNIALHDQGRDIFDATGEELDELLRQNGLPIVPSRPATFKVAVRVFGGGSVDVEQDLLVAMPNGTHATVAREYPGVVNNGHIQITTVETGESQNITSGVVRWVQAPLNVGAEMQIVELVSRGTNEESDKRKQERLQNKIQNSPGGGNWAHHVEVALNVDTEISAYIFPALGGACQLKAVLVNPIDRTLNLYSRQVDDTTISNVGGAFDSEMPDGVFRRVDTATAQPSDHAMAIDIPSGGDPAGWVNGLPWPSLHEDDAGRVTVTQVTSGSSFRISANTTVAPVAGTTKISRWNPETQRPERGRIETVSGSAGAWDVTTDVSFDGLAVGDFISPAANREDAYADSFIAAMGELGPGEQSANATILADSRRLPYSRKKDPSDVTSRTLDRIGDDHPEIANAQWSYNSATTPTIPSVLADPPYILTPRRFAIYPLE